MNPFDYSKPINLWYTSDSSEYYKLVVKIRDTIEAELRAKHGLIRFNKSDHEKALFHILADLFVMYKADINRYLAFSRDKLWYSKNTRYQPKKFAFQPFINVIDALDSLGYIISRKGFQYCNSGNSRIARMIATDKLATLFDRHKLTVTEFYQIPIKESIILKAPKNDQGNKTLIDYEDTADTLAMRGKLKLINENIGKQWIDLKITDEQFTELQDKLSTIDNEDKSPINFTNTNLHRVFNNGSFEQGGRFYGGWWLSIPSEYRSRITINGKKTVELDYSAMHFYMMYAEKGLPIPDSDPYTLVGIDRKKAKLALNTALNASSKGKALSAIKANQWPDKTITEVTTILDKLLVKHKAISEYFLTGKGLELQFKDSTLAELVMLNMWNKHGVIVLPVHDSFIVNAASIDDLKAEMLTSFDEITGYTVKIKASEPDETLKSTLDRLAQKVMYIDSSQLPKVGVGVNAADTWDAYNQQRGEYTGYNLRKQRYNLMEY
jgi:hypothetical protein